MDQLIKRKPGRPRKYATAEEAAFANRKLTRTRAARKREDERAGKPKRVKITRKEQRQAYRELNRKLIKSLKTLPCVDCKNTFPPCAMDFDHVGDDKVKAISQMLMESQRKILTEIAKCELVCSNCHRVRTQQRRLTKKEPKDHVVN